MADVTVTTPREAGYAVIKQRGSTWGRLNQLEDDLDDAYEEIQCDHDHEQQLDQAVAKVRTTDRTTTLYKAAIAGLLAVVILLAVLLFF